jgi:hypothetical protein
VIETAEALLRQPICKVAGLTSTDIPLEPGVYAWYRSGRLFYVGESHRGLRSRLWGNHLRGNARGSTLRNKVAQASGFPPTGKRAYGRDAEQAISMKLLECELRFHPVVPALIDETQAQLIRELDPPMNDHPGEMPRWRIADVREILAITTRQPSAPAPRADRKAAMSSRLAESQRVTPADISAGRIRFPRAAKSYFPKERENVRIVLRGVQLDARYDPRTGPDKERSAVLLVGKANLEELVQADDVLSISLADGIVRID